MTTRTLGKNQQIILPAFQAGNHTYESLIEATGLKMSQVKSACAGLIARGLITMADTSTDIVIPQNKADALIEQIAELTAKVEALTQKVDEQSDMIVDLQQRPAVVTKAPVVKQPKTIPPRPTLPLVPELTEDPFGNGSDMVWAMDKWSQDCKQVEKEQAKWDKKYAKQQSVLSSAPEDICPF